MHHDLKKESVIDNTTKIYPQLWGIGGAYFMIDENVSNVEIVKNKRIDSDNPKRSSIKLVS